MNKLIFLLTSIILLITLAKAQNYNKLDKLKVNDLLAAKLEVQSTTTGSMPCPSMTQVQRDAISAPIEGQCIYNSAVKTLNLYDGTAWVAVAGGEGGISKWEDAKFYEVDNVVISGNDIYICTEEHTSSGSFDPSKFSILAQDLSSTTGVLAMSKGGTDKALTPVLGGLVYTDDLSMEVLPSGDSGKFLQSNGAAAPSWESVAIDNSAFIGVLSMEKGGTGANLTPSHGGIVYSDAASFDILGAGTAGEVLMTNGDNSAPQWSSVTDSMITGVIPLSKGGTGESLTAVNGGIVYSDSDSLEITAIGEVGQVLESTAAGIPEFKDKSLPLSAQYGIAEQTKEIQVPNYQKTIVEPGKQLVETGNKNILENPSFEQEAVNAGWIADGPFNENTTTFIHGKKSMYFNALAQQFYVYQDSTLYQAAYSEGVQGVVTAMIKSSVPGKICSRNNGVRNDYNCLQLFTDNTWRLYKLPTILRGGSNGLEVTTTSPVTGTLFIDDAFVGPESLTSTQSIGVCPTAACQESFSVVVTGSNGQVNSESVDWLDGNCTRSSAGKYSCPIISGTFSQLPSCGVSLYRATTSGTYIWSSSQSTSAIAVDVIQDGLGRVDATQFQINCQKQGADYEAALQAQRDYQESTVESYSTPSNDTDWQSCGHTTSSFTGFGTVTGIETQCKRDGSDLLMKGKFTAGAPTAVEARVSLPLWNGTQLVSAGTQKIPSVQVAGPLASSYFSSTYYSYMALIEPSVNYMTMGLQINTASSLTKGTGAGIAATGSSISFNARIPIDGWENSNIIIGQFNGLERCENTLECTDTFSAKVSIAGVVSDENVNWINGNASVSARVYTFSVPNIFTVVPICVATSTSGSVTAVLRNIVFNTSASTSSSLQFFTERTSDGSGLSSAFNIICQKQGVDYIGKIAKAVASDQNISTPGTIKSTFCSAKISTTGVVSNDKGACISSCTNANPMICTFNTNYWASEPNCKASSETDNATWCNVITTSSSSTSLRCFNNNGANTFVTSVSKSIMCHGERQ